MNTLNALMTAAFFAPMALLVATNLLTARTEGPDMAALKGRRIDSMPQPTNRAQLPAANEHRYLEAA